MILLQSYIFMKIQLHVGINEDLSFDLRHFWQIVHTAEIIEKNGWSFQDFWRYTMQWLMVKHVETPRNLQ